MEARAYDLKWLHLPDVYVFKSTPSASVCARSVTLMYVFGGFFSSVCVRRCGRVRKKHHCEADEDPTRQRLQRRVSAVRNMS